MKNIFKIFGLVVLFFVLFFYSSSITRSAEYSLSCLNSCDGTVYSCQYSGLPSEQWPACEQQMKQECKQKCEIPPEPTVANPGYTKMENKPDFSSAQKFSEEAARTSGVDTQSTLESKVASIVNYALSLLGIIFLMLMVYGGYIWMMARGEEAEAAKAKNIITMGVIGMAIVIAAYAIAFFVVSRLVAGAA